ncbi:hypothetical protein TorRG33x02_254860 [Trema orientale]|uniref:Uncharacterized protein n=1 Tax=Trema orientale TaxID=63057 RepID=A0A2P5DD28_TREOI|nr:hypothetical protein TorRG33x02_254860 [Trema orientale]
MHPNPNGAVSTLAPLPPKDQKKRIYLNGAAWGVEACHPRAVKFKIWGREEVRGERIDGFIALSLYGFALIDFDSDYGDNDDDYEHG